MESALFQFVPIVSSPLIHYYWKESVSAFFIRSLQIFIHIDEIPQG